MVVAVKMGDLAHRFIWIMGKMNEAKVIGVDQMPVAKMLSKKIAPRVPIIAPRRINADNRPW